MKTVIFIKEFAGKKVGERFSCDSMLASHLVNVDKVAKYVPEVPEVPEVPKKRKKRK